MIMAPMEAPLPMPAFAPVDKVEADVEDGVCEGRGVDAGSVRWAVLVSDCVADEVGAVKDDEEEEGEGTGEDDDFSMEFPVLVLDGERCNVGVLAKDSYVDMGCPRPGNRILLTPVLQQSAMSSPSQQKSRSAFV